MLAATQCKLSALLSCIKTYYVFLYFSVRDKDVVDFFILVAVQKLTAITHTPAHLYKYLVLLERDLATPVADVEGGVAGVQLARVYPTLGHCS